MTDKDSLALVLKQHGHNLTSARIVVFAALADNGPMNMKEIADAVGRKANRATVYRVLALFEVLGIVQRLQIGWKHKFELSDVFQRHHHHFTCRRCGRIITLKEDKLLENKLNELAGEQNFRMTGHQIEIQGMCQSCQIINV